MNNNYNSNTVVKQDFSVVKQVDGRAGIHDRHNSAPELAEHPPPPPHQSMLDPSLRITVIKCSPHSPKLVSVEYLYLRGFHNNTKAFATWQNILAAAITERLFCVLLNRMLQLNLVYTVRLLCKSSSRSRFRISQNGG